MARKFAPYFERLRAVAGAPSGRRFAVGGERDVDVGAGVSRSRVHVFNASKRSHTAAVELPTAVGALVFLCDDLLVAGGRDGWLIAIDAGAAEPTVVGTFEGPGGAVTALATDTVGKTLVATSEDGRVAAYRLEVEAGKPKLACVGRRSMSPRPLRCAALDPSKARFAVGGDDGIVRALPLEGLETAELREMPTGEGGVHAVVTTADGRIIAGCGDGSVRISFLDGAPDEENRSGDAAHERPVRGLVLGPLLRDQAGQELPRRLFSAGRTG